MTWRPLPRPGTPDDPRPPRPVGDSLDSMTRAMGIAPAQSLSRVFDHWAELVGPAVAAHTRPLSLVRGTLTVAVDQPAWGAQLTWLETDLLHRFEGALGTGVVRSITVRVRPR